jgi:LmbE family N-acetylglucosaminyl deacetylase
MAEGFAAWSVPEMWFMAAPEERQDHAVDITATVDLKLAALDAHASQTAHRSDIGDWVRGLGRGVGQRFGLAEGRLAEAFQVVTIG